MPHSSVAEIQIFISKSLLQQGMNGQNVTLQKSYIFVLTIRICNAKAKMKRFTFFLFLRSWNKYNNWLISHHYYSITWNQKVALVFPKTPMPIHLTGISSISFVNMDGDWLQTLIVEISQVLQCTNHIRNSVSLDVNKGLKYSIRLLR